MRFDILTLFPNILDSYLDESIIGRAQRNKIISVHKHDIRDASEDNYGTVDDKPYGGGVGMVMKVDTIFRTLQGIPVEGKKSSVADMFVSKKKPPKQSCRVVMLTPRGKRLTQRTVRRLSKYDQIVMINGRYEGIDERVSKMVHEEVSIGDYVLTGGEIGSLVLVDAVTRLLPGALGKDASSVEESFSKPNYREYPQYTRPEVFSPSKDVDWKVPNILLSGDHKKIEQWREKHSR